MAQFPQTIEIIPTGYWRLLPATATCRSTAPNVSTKNTKSDLEQMSVLTGANSYEQEATDV